MYGKKFYRRRPRKYLRRRKTTGKRRTTVSSRIRRYVKKELHRNLENKERCNYAVNSQIISSDVTTSTFPLIIQTTQGTGEENRIGNQFKIVKGQIRFCVNYLPYDATTNPSPMPVWVRIMVLRDLTQTYQSATLPVGTYNGLLRAGATPFTFGGNPLDMCASVNKDFVRVLYDKTVKLGTSYPGNNGGANWYSDNSPFGRKMTINWGKWARKQIKCSDGASYPNNENLYLVLQPVYADGSNSSGKRLIEWHYSNVMQFEDA